MPVRVLSKEAGPGVQVPTHLTRIPIADISINTDCTGKSVKGRVLHKGPLVSLNTDNFLLKAVLQEDAEPDAPSINIILMGALAKEFSQAANQGDVVVASGFSVGKSPTHHKDKLHCCNLQLSGEHAWLFVSRPLPPPDPRSPAALKRGSPLSAEVSMKPKAPKYTYVRLNELKPCSVVNVYGVVVFFKQPFRSRGTDYCSSLKITDQSDQKICCTIFCKKLEDHPNIFQIGDIIRLHRVKTKVFSDSITLVNTFGFSAVTFDGADGAPVEPRTSSKSFHFDQEDVRKVAELRSWAASQAILPPLPTIPLCDVEPKAYFDLTCQLLAKAPIDSTCTLLRVWDGTRCRHPLLKALVEPTVMEGPPSFSAEIEELVANIFVYDNHVEFARQLKPGDFLRIFNLRAIPGCSKVPGLPSSQTEEADHLAFYLHGGTTYGRGIRILPESSPDIQKLKRNMEPLLQHNEVNDSELLEIWCTPPQSPPGAQKVQINSERRSPHNMQRVALSELKRAHPGGLHHVRVQLRSFEPRRLHQALKLYCCRCSTMWDVPDEEQLAGVFSEALRDSGPCSPPQWSVSGQVVAPVGQAGSSRQPLTFHSSTQLLSKGGAEELLLLAGATLEQTSQMTSCYKNIIPVMSSEGHMTLLDLAVPFLFRGRKRFYGCRQCSSATLTDPYVKGQDVIDEKSVAKALGVQLLQFVLLMKLRLQDATDTLDAFLWRDAELFFGVSAEIAAANQEAQDLISRTMSSLCPPEGSTGERPWLDVCVTSYLDGDHNQTCHQICHTSIIRHASAGW